MKASIKITYINNEIFVDEHSLQVIEDFLSDFNQLWPNDDIWDIWWDTACWGPGQLLMKQNTEYMESEL